MNINATLLGQMIAFGMFVYFCMKYVWPPLIKSINDRQEKIADGLAAAEHGQHEKQLAKQRASEILKEAKAQASEIIEQANKRATVIVEEAKEEAKTEAERVKAGAEAELEQQFNRAKEDLRGQVVSIALAGAEKVLDRAVNEKDHADALDKLVAEL